MARQIWLLTTEYNQYDQYGEYFVAAFEEFPTIRPATCCPEGRQSELAPVRRSTGSHQERWWSGWCRISVVQPRTVQPSMTPRYPWHLIVFWQDKLRRGMPIKELAMAYGMGVREFKKVLREYDMKIHPEMYARKSATKSRVR